MVYSLMHMVRSRHRCTYLFSLPMWSTWSLLSVVTSSTPFYSSTQGILPLPWSAGALPAKAIHTRPLVKTSHRNLTLPH